MANGTESKLNFFDRYLTVWVGVCIVLGTAIGYFFPVFSKYLGGIEVANVSIPVAVVLLIMMYPIMLKISLKEALNFKRNSKPLILTSIVNWMIKPFTMAFIAWFFMRILYSTFIPASLQSEYIAGMILLGLAPCTAMVFVWTHLAKANIHYALIQVSVDDIVLIILFAPLGKFLLGMTTDFPVPMATIFKGMVPFVLAMIVVIFILTVFPDLALFIPNSMDTLPSIGN